MQKQSISNWMKSFYYGRPITSRPARTTAGHYRTIVGVLVVSLIALHLGYLLLLSPTMSWSLVGLLVVSIVFYLAYVMVRMRMPTLWETRYYTPRIQMIRAQSGILSTTVLLVSFAYFDQPNVFWPLLLLPVMIVSEHCSTNKLLGVLVEVVIILLGITWLGNGEPLSVFLQSPFAFQGLAQGLTMVLLGFLMHYTMRNLDARDKRIDQLCNLLTRISQDLPAQRDPQTAWRTGLGLFMETVGAQHGTLWVADRQAEVLRLMASLRLAEGQIEPVRLILSGGIVRLDLSADEESLPARVMRTCTAHCISRSGDVPAALAYATLDRPPLFDDTAVEIAVPVKVFRLHKPESIAVLALGFAHSMGKEELRRVYLTAVEIADVLASLFYFASLTEERLALRDLGHAVSRNMQQEQVIDALLEIVTGTLGFDFAAVSLVDEVKQIIATVGGRNVDEAWLKKAVHSLESNDIQADIIRTGKTEILTGWDDRFDREIWEQFGHEKMVRIFLPMKVADQATGRPKRIGTVEAGYWEAAQAQIAPAQVGFLEPFVNQAAVALHNARLYEQAQRRADALQRLHDVGQNIQQAVWSVSRLMKEIGDSALSVLRADIVFLYGYDEGKHHIEQLHTAGEVWGRTPLSVRLGEDNILDWIIDRQRPFYTCDAQNSPELVGYGPSDGKQAKYRTFTQRQEVQAFAGVPLMAGKRLIGIMCVNYRQTQIFSDEVKHIIELFAQLAAVALENSRLKELDKELALRKERNHLSRELHDAAVQDLYGIGLKVHTWLKEPNTAPTTVIKLEQILELAESVNNQIGYIVSELRAPLLSSQDFRETIRDTAERLQQFYNLKVSYQGDGIGPMEVSPLANTTLAHVAKEALTNAFRYAQAQCVTVRCWHKASDNTLCLEIHDDGIGFDLNRPRRNKHGLINMHEFAREAKGHLDIDTAPGQGTRILVSVPLDSAQEGQEEDPAALAATTDSAEA